jgi:hypothetical protein
MREKIGARLVFTNEITKRKKSWKKYLPFPHTHTHASERHSYYRILQYTAETHRASFVRAPPSEEQCTIHTSNYKKETYAEFCVVDGHKR